MFRQLHRPRRPSCTGLALSLALLGAGPAAATQEYILPTLFDVSGVAADDVLNIRGEPGADAEIIGTLAPDARRIEVVAHDESGRWAQVNTRERSGWVALRYLNYRTDVWEEVAAFERRKPARKPFPEHLPRERVVLPGLLTAPIW